MKNILLAESDAVFAASMKKCLSLKGYSVSIAESEYVIQRCMESTRFSAIILNADIGQKTKNNLVKQLASGEKARPILILVNEGQENIAAESLQDGAAGFIVRDTGDRYLIALPAMIERIIALDAKICEKEESIRHIKKRNNYLGHVVKRRTKRLITNAMQTEAFAYAIAYDIYEPLSVVSGFTQMLLNEKIDDEKERNHYLQNVSGGVKKIGDILDGLHNLLQAGQKKSNKIVSLSDKAEELLVCMKLRDNKERTVHLEIAKNLTVSGDPRLLSLALQCLLTKAYQAAQGENITVVKFGKELTTTSGMAFYVKYNHGQEHHHETKTYLLPRYAYTPQRRSGSDIGMTTFISIVRNHNGRVWIESSKKTENTETTVYFTLGENDR